MCGLVILRLFDWKRTKNLSDEFTNPYRSLLPPLSHLPDATGVKYCLQLNVYKHILQKHYGATVSGMFVVCLHPQLAQPWIYPVPIMDREVEAVMSLRRRDIAQLDERMVEDAPGGSICQEDGFLAAIQACNGVDTNKVFRK